MEWLSSIVVALIALLGTVITNLATSRKNGKQYSDESAVTDTKLDELTREVREHNNYARRMPVVEEQIKVINPSDQRPGT